MNEIELECEFYIDNMAMFKRNMKLNHASDVQILYNDLFESDVFDRLLNIPIKTYVDYHEDEFIHIKTAKVEEPLSLAEANFIIRVLTYLDRYASSDNLKKLFSLMDYKEYDELNKQSYAEDYCDN